MSKGLLGEEEYNALLDCNDFKSAINYIRTLPGYAESFAGTIDEDLHREMCERRLMNSLYSDYCRLYHFSSLKVREYLEVYFKHYEILLIKQALRNVINLLSSDIQLESFDEFFHAHSEITMDGINHCDTIPEFMNALAGSEYEVLLMPIYQSGSKKLSEYEEALDFYYFSQTWRVLKKTLTGKEQKAIINSFGSDVDLCNLRWIIRCKRIYKLSATDTKRMLIPIRYKLSEKTIDALVNTENESEIWSIIGNTVYKNKLSQSDMDNLGNAQNRIITDIYKKEKRNNPYSLATVADYLYEKESEIESIIKILEAIRYGLTREESLKFLPQNVKKGVLSYDR